MMKYYFDHHLLLKNNRMQYYNNHHLRLNYNMKQYYIDHHLLLNYYMMRYYIYHHLLLKFVLMHCNRITIGWLTTRHYPISGRRLLEILFLMLMIISGNSINDQTVYKAVNVFASLVYLFFFSSFMNKIILFTHFLTWMVIFENFTR